MTLQNRRQFLKTGIFLAGAVAFPEVVFANLIELHEEYYKKRGIQLRKSDWKLIEFFYTLPTKELYTGTIYGEGRSCSEEEKAWIGYCPINRAENKGKTLRHTILEPGAFKCFAPTSEDQRENIYNLLDAMLKRTETWKKCEDIAINTLREKIEIPNYQQTAYVTKNRWKEIVIENLIPLWLNPNKMLSAPKEFQHIFFTA